MECTNDYYINHIEMHYHFFFKNYFKTRTNSQQTSYCNDSIWPKTSSKLHGYCKYKTHYFKGMTDTYLSFIYPIPSSKIKISPSFQCFTNDKQIDCSSDFWFDLVISAREVYVIVLIMRLDKRVFYTTERSDKIITV